jgi:uncharacterized protein YjbI with pentapeptide repeats
MTSTRKAVSKDDLIALLRGGSDGKAMYNDQVAGKKKRTALGDVDLSGVNLSGIDFSSTDLRGANLSGCDLQDGKLDGADVSGANFSKANLKNVSGLKVKAIGDCSALDLSEAFICGGRFCGAQMENVLLDRTQFDEQTVLPEALLADAGLLWIGRGANPSKLQAIRNANPSEPLDFGKFLTNLEVSIEKERLKKAIKMLKAESFQLFAEVGDSKMVGVVKSQTDPNLVYACILTDDGRFCCGTQNLNPCGGLRGALCKHLLVLLMGLTNAGKLDATDADKWAQMSKLQQPKMDKDLMSETFLRYKGAEAGEIDWRPTETIPEDYYAF